MTDADEIQRLSPEEEQIAQRETDNTIHRILRTMVILALLFTGVIWYLWGMKVALGFVVGCALSIINFKWLRFTTVGITNAAARHGQRTSTFGMLYRVVLRYALIGAAAYAMINSSVASVYGLLPGLFLPTAALMIETLVQGARALKRDGSHS